MKRVLNRLRRATRPQTTRSTRKPRPLSVSLASYGSTFAMLGALLAGGSFAKAATYYWDADGSAVGNTTAGAFLGGNGLWNTSSALWWNGVATTGADSTWPNALGDTAIFSGPFGAISLGAPINAGTLQFTTFGYNLIGNGNTLTLENTAAPGLLKIDSAGVTTLGAILAGSQGLTLSSTSAGILALTGANTYTGTTTISSGTLSAFTDAALGTATNGITFDGANGGLTLNGPTVLGASRQVTLNNTGAVSLSSTGAEQEVVLGKVTGSGALNVSNTGTTYLLNATNDFTGALGAQTGTVSAASLADSATLGAGNIRLGATTTSGTFQWASGAAAPLALNFRQIELAGTTGGGTIDSSATSAASTITINTDLLVSGNGAKTLTLTGNNRGTNTIAGAIANSPDFATVAADVTNITKTGMALWSLGSSASTYSGLITVSQGILRFTDVGALGTGGNLSIGANVITGVEFRFDSAASTINTSRNISNNSSANGIIFVDHTIGGTSTNKTIVLGTVNQLVNSAGFLVFGDHGYGLTTGLNTVNGGVSNTFTNDLGAPGFSAPGYSNGILTMGGYTTNAAGAATGTISGWGESLVNGPISTNGTASFSFTKSGIGLLTFAPSSISGWGTGTGAIGTVTSGGGTFRATGAAPFGGNNFASTSGVFEYRTDSATGTLGNITSLGTSSILLDHTVGGTGSGTNVTFGTVGGASTVLSIVSDHGYNASFGLITTLTTKGLTFANYLSAPGFGGAGYTPGKITLSGVGTDATVSASADVLTLSGYGDFNDFDGTTGTNAINTATSGALLNIAKSNLGVVTFSGSNAGWTQTGTGLTTTMGTTRIIATDASVLGTVPIGLSGGMTEIRINGNAAFTAHNVTDSVTSTLVAAPLIGSNTTGNTVTFGGLNMTAKTQTLSVDTNHNYGVNFSAPWTTTAIAITDGVLSNLGNGAITLAGGITTSFGTTTTTTGTTIYTLTGPGDFNVSGNITQSGFGVTALTKSGFGTTTLSGAGNNLTGNISLGGGILRLTTSGALGGAASGSGTFATTGNTIATNGLDLRSDTGIDVSGTTRLFTSSYNTVFNVDRAIGGTGTNQTMILPGGNGFGNNGWGFTITGANGYSLQFGSAANTTPFGINSGQANETFVNFIPSVAVGSGTAGVIFGSGLSLAGVAGASGITLAGTGDYVLSGTLVAGGGGAGVNTLTKSGQGTLVISGNNSSSTSLAGFNTQTTTLTSASVLALTGGLTRVSVGNNLGGANTSVTLNAATLDLRNDAGQTFAETFTMAGNNAYLNIDRAIGGSGTGQTMSLGALKSAAATSFFTNGNNYSLNTGTLTQTGAAILVNELTGTGTLTIPTLTGTFAATLSGPGATNITTALTLATGTFTKAGTGTVTISGNASNTNGAVAVNGGTLSLDYSAGAANNILQSAALTIANGTLSIKGNGTTDSQTFTTVALSAGQDNITMVAGTGTSNSLTTGAVTPAAGSTSLLTAPSGTTINLGTALNVSTAQGRNLVFTPDGTTFNWATNTGATTATTGLTGLTALPATGGTSTVNYQVTGAGTTFALTGTTAGNSLKLDGTGGGGILDLATFTLTLTQGGVLYSGANDFTIQNSSTTTGLKSNIATTSDTIINNYGTGTLTISAPIITGNGVNTATFGGTGKTVVGNASLTAIGNYTGVTFVNGGTVQLASMPTFASTMTRLGATTSSGLTVNGGTFDLNGANLGVGAFAGAYAGTIDNTFASAATLTIGNGNGAGTYLGNIKNTGGALSIVKTGTGTITLGDVNGMSTYTYTGDLTNSGGTTSIIAVTGIADTSSTKINLGTATTTDSPTFKFIGSTNLALSNRQFDLTGLSGGTIDGSGVVGLGGTAAVLTINKDLLTDGAGSKTLTLTGSAGNVLNGGTVSGMTGTAVSLINTFAGAIGNPSGSGITTSLAIAGAGGWAITGNNTFTGGVALNGTGLVRLTNANSFGGAANTIVIGAAATPTLDLRSDSSVNFANPVTMNNSFTINVDRAVGGSGYGGVMSIGTLTENVSGKTLTVNNNDGVANQLGSSNPINAYGLRIAGLVLNVGSATSIANGLGSQSSAIFAVPAAGTGVAGALVIDGITTAAGLGAHTLSFSASSNTAGVNIITGDIVQSTGTTLALTYGGANYLTLAGQTASTNFSGGLTISNANGIVRATNQYSLGTGPVSYTAAGALEVRTDTDVTYANTFTLGAAAVGKLNVGESVNGSSANAKLVTFGNVNITATVAGSGLTVAGAAGLNSSGDSVTLGNVNFVANNASITSTITNSLLLPGVLTLGNVTNTSTTGTQTLVIAGAGVTTLLDVSNSANGGLTGLSYTGTGILDLSRVTSATNYSGGVSVGGAAGILRVSSQYGLGASANVLTFNGGGLELRADTDTAADFSSHPILSPGGGVLNIGQVPGGAGSTGVNFSFSQYRSTASGKTLTISGIGGSTVSVGDSVNFNGVDLTGVALTTIANNLLLPGQLNLGNVTSTAANAAAVVLAIGGAGVTTLGDVTNGLATAVGVSINQTASGFLDLSRMTGATNYTGGLLLTGGGTVRVTGLPALSTIPIQMSNGTLEARSDTGFTATNGGIVWNSSANANINIAVGQLPGGTGNNGGVNKTFNFGPLSINSVSANTAARVLTVAGVGVTGANNGDSVTISGVTFGGGAVGTTTVNDSTIQNNLNLPGVLALGNITGAGASTVNNGTGVVALTINGLGFTTVGDIANSVAGSTTSLVYAGTGILQITGTSSTATNFTSGLKLTGNGTLRTIGAFSFGPSTNVITLAGSTGNTGTLDVRNDATFSVPNPILVNANGVGINVDQATSGHLSNTVTFSGSATAISVAKTLTLTSGSNYGMTFTNGFNVSIAAANITNNASGPVSLGTIAYSGAAAGALTLAGSGQTMLNAMTGTAAAVSYAGSGTLKPTATNTFAGLTSLSIAGTGAGNTATLDLTGFNQTITAPFTLGGSTATSSSQVFLGNSDLTLSSAANTLAVSATGAPLGSVISADGGTGKLRFGVANAVIAAARSATNVVGAAGNPLGADLIISAPIFSTPGGINLTGTGLVAFTNPGNSYGGVTTITAGTLNFVNGALSTSNLAMNGGTLQFANANTQDVSAKTVTFGGTAIFDTNGNNVTFANAVGGSAAFGFTKSGAGTLYLSTANNFGSNSVVTINGGTLKVDNEAALGGVTNDLTFANGGTLEVTTGFTGDIGKVYSFSGAGGGVLQIDAGTQTINSVLTGASGAGGLVKTGAGTLVLTGNNLAYDSTGVGVSGATGVGFRVDAGSLVLSGATAGVVGDANPATMTIQLNGGNLGITTDTASIDKANLYLSNTGTLTVDRLTSGAGIIENIGTNANNGLTFGTGSGTFNVTAGNNIASGTESVSFLSTTSLLVDPTFNITNPTTGTGVLTVTLGGLNDNGTVRTITKTGTGTLILGAAASALQDGTAFKVASGTLSVTNATAMGANGLSTVEVGSAGIFNVGVNQTIAALTATTSGTGSLVLGSGFTLTLGNSTTNPSQTITTNISGPGNLAKAGSGTMLINTAQTFTGTLGVLDGFARLAGGNNRLAGSVSLGNAATSGKLILGGDATGAPGTDPTPGNQVLQTLTQNSATNALSVSGAGLLNSVVGGAAGGTSAGTPDNNSVLNLNIGTGFTDTYSGLIGYDGVGAIGFQNNINLTKSGGGTLVLTGNLTNWTGTMGGTSDPTRPYLTLSGGVLRLPTGAVINTLIKNTGGLIDDQGYVLGPNGSIVTTGGLLTVSSPTDTFAGAGITSSSHGVVALNFNNSGVADYAGSDIFLGAVGARIYSGTTLAPGAVEGAGTTPTYRFGGGAPINAIGSATVGGSGGYLQIAAQNVVTGPNDVIIGDNGLTGIFGGRSTVEFVKDQDFSGVLTVRGGTLQFDGALGSSTAANSILLDGGTTFAPNGTSAILRYGPGITTDLSSRIGIVSGGSIDTAANNVVFATGLANTAGGTGGLHKLGTGTLTLTGASTYAGPTTVSLGTLQLNGATGSLAATSGLNLAGPATFRFDNVGAGGTTGQTLGALAFTAGDGVILSQRTVPQNTTLTFASLTPRAAGATGNFTVAGSGATTALNQVNFTTAPSVAGQFIDPGLYVGGTDFAVIDATGYVRAIAYGTDKDSTGTITSINQATTASIPSNSADVNVTGAITSQNTATIESLKITGATAFSFTSGGGQFLTINSGGIIKTGATANLGSAATNGNVMAGATGTGELLVRLDASTDALLFNSNLIAGAVTKSGLGALTLAGTNTITGQFAINGGSVTAGVAQFGASTGITINGGTLVDNSTTSFAKLFTLGLGGGTISTVIAGNATLGTPGDELIFAGGGARTLTLNTSTDRKSTYQFSVGDGGGPTSLIVTSNADSGITVLNAANTYTGPTTITRGILQLASAGALPGGRGGSSLTSSNTGGGNLSFAGGANRAILELTDASGGFYRSVGTGLDQVQWTGNGGFSNASITANQIVNLGGSAATLVWGSPGFVSTSSVLQFGEQAGNSNATGTFAIDFQNGINLNGAPRTVDVANTNAVYEAILSGNLTNSSGTAAVFTKTGLGAVQLTGTNNAGTTGAITTTVSGGVVAFLNTTSAVPGINGDTTSRSITVGVNSAILQPGATDLSALLGRISASLGVVAFDTSSNTDVDLSTNAAFANIYLGAFSGPGGTPVIYTGNITPNNNVYKFANSSYASSGAATAGVGIAENVLVLGGNSRLVDGGTARSAVFGSNATNQGGAGDTYITGYNTFTGGTTVGQPTGALGNTTLGLGNDAALGTGKITLAAAATGNLLGLASLNGDRTISNNVVTTATTTNVTVASNANDGVVNAGALTYLGTSNFSSLTTGGLFSRSATVPAIFIGDLITSTANNLVVVGSTSNVGVVEFLTTPAGSTTKTWNNNNKGISLTTNPAATIVIDSTGSLGSGPTAPTVGFINFGVVLSSNLEVLPGITSAVAFPSNAGVVAGASGSTAGLIVPGAPSFTDSNAATTTGLIGNSDLRFAGPLTGSSSNAVAFQKIGLGTLTLLGKSTVNFTTGNPIAVQAGTLKLDFANSAASDPIFTVTMGAALGATTVPSSGGTLALVGKSGQTNSQLFGVLALAARDNAINVNSNGGTVNLTLSTITNTLGGTLAVTLPASGTVTIPAAQTVSTNTTGLLVDANANAFVVVNGNTWGQLSGTSLIGASTSGPAPSPTTFYTPNSATALVANSNADITSSAVLAAGPTIASLRFNAASANTLDLGGTTTLTTGGILMGTGTSAGASNFDQTISNGTLQGIATKNLPIYQANANANLNISAVIAGATVQLTKSGPGTVVLGTTFNTYSGATVINQGVLSIGLVNNAGTTAGAVPSPLGSSPNAATNLVFNGGTLLFTGLGANTTDRGATFNTPSAIDIKDVNATLTMTSGTIAITGQAATPGILRKIGAGTLAIAGTTGGNANLSIEVASGTLLLAKTGVGVAVQQANGAGLIIDAGATAKLNAGSAATQIDPNTTVVVKTVGASVGTFELNGVSATFDGLAGNGTVTNSLTTPVSTLTLGQGNDIALSPYTIGSAAAGVASTGLNNFSGTLSGAINLAKTGYGTQILSGTSTYSGTTTITVGTLRTGATNALPSGTGKGDLTINGPTTFTGISVPAIFDLGGFNQTINGLKATDPNAIVTTTPTVSNPGSGYGTTTGSAFSTSATSGTTTLSVGNNATPATFAGSLQDGYSVIPVAGAGAGTGVTGLLAFNKIGTGTQTLSGNNTYSGGTTVSGGTLILASANALGATTAALNLAGGTLDLGNVGRTVGAVTISGTATVTTAQNGTITGTSYTATNTAGVATIPVNLLGGSTVALTKSGAGTLALSGTNTYGGGTTINGGVLSIGLEANLATNTNVGVADLLINDGTLQSTGTFTTTRSIKLGTGTPTIDVADTKQLDLANALTGTGANGLTVKSSDGSHTGILQLDTAASYSGPTTVSSGVLRAGVANALPTGTDLTVASGATFRLGDFNQQLDGLAGTGTVTTATATPTLLVNSTSMDSTFDGTISGTLGLTTAGTKTLTLRSTTNSYGGATVIGSGSTLQLGDGSATHDGSIDSSTGISNSGALIYNSFGTALSSPEVITGAGTVTKTGTGTQTLTGVNGYTGLTTVSGGTLNFGNSAIAAIHLTNTGSTLGITRTSTTVGSPVEFSAISSTTTPTAAKVLTATSLTSTSFSLDAGTKLNLSNNALVVSYGGGGFDPYANLRLAAENGIGTGTDATDSRVGHWDASVLGGGALPNPSIGSLVTTAVDVDMDTVGTASTGFQDHLTAIGVVDNVDSTSGMFVYPSGNKFMGRTLTDTSSVLVRYTLYGDTNLDGKITGADYIQIDNGYSATHDPMTGLEYAVPSDHIAVNWFNGDFNYDGHIDSSDYSLIDTANLFSLGGGPGSSSAEIVQEHAEQFGESYTQQVASLMASSGPAAVPEPGSFAMLAAGGLLLGLRRRRSAVK